MSEQYYESQYYGAEIDEAVGAIINGDIKNYATRAEEAAKKAESFAVKTPYINATNRNWMVVDTATGNYKDSGIKAEGKDGVVVNLGPGEISFQINENGHLIMFVKELNTDFDEVTLFAVQNEDSE